MTCSISSYAVTGASPQSGYASLRNVSVFSTSPSSAKLACTSGLLRERAKKDIVPRKAKLKIQRAWFAGALICAFTAHPNGLLNYEIRLWTSWKQCPHGTPSSLPSAGCRSCDSASRRPLSTATPSSRGTVVDGLWRSCCIAVRSGSIGGFKMAVCLKHARRLGEGEEGPQQSEVVVAHKRRRVLESAPMAEPYDVCQVLRGEENNSMVIRRWTAAGNVTPGQLQEYWDSMDAQAHVAAFSSSACFLAFQMQDAQERGRAALRMALQM